MPLQTCLFTNLDSLQKHPSVVEIFGLAMVGQDLHLVMEFAPYGDLLVYCQQHKLVTRTRLGALERVRLSFTFIPKFQLFLNENRGFVTWTWADSTDYESH